MQRLKKRNKTRAQESASIRILEEAFGNRGQYTGFSATYENIDGCLELYDENLTPLNIKVFCQVKSTENDDKNDYPFEIEHLNYFFKEPTPTILFFIKVPKKEIYYVIASKYYISKVLKIDPQTHTGGTKTIKFTEQNLFTGDIDKFVADYHVEEFELTRMRQLEASSQPASKNEVIEHKKVVTQIVATEAEKIYEIEALIYYYFPVRLTDIDLVKKIADKVGIKGSEMDYLLQKMFSAGLLKNIKNLVSVKDPKVAQKLLDDIIAEKGVTYLL